MDNTHDVTERWYLLASIDGKSFRPIQTRAAEGSSKEEVIEKLIDNNMLDELKEKYKLLFHKEIVTTEVFYEDLDQLEF